MSYSVSNSSISPLGIGETFTGGWEECFNSNQLHVSLEADQVGTLQVDFTDEPDKGAIHTAEHFVNVRASVKELRTFHVLGRYFRLVFANTSGANQTLFQLYTHLKTNGVVKSNLGYENNLLSNTTLNFGVSTSAFDVMHFNQCNLLWRDSLIASSDGFDIETSLDGTNWWIHTSTNPNVSGAERKVLVPLDLHGLRYIRITNTSLVDNYTNCYCSVVGIN